MPSPSPNLNTTNPAAAPPSPVPKPSNPNPTTHPDLPPLPPQLTNFSLLPDLYLLLSRLSSLQPNAASSQNTSQNPQSAQNPSTTTSSTLPLPIPQALSPTSNPTSALNSSELIDPKSLPTHIFPLKQRIQAAKSMVEGVPDVERGLGMQEEEIRVLEGRCQGLRRRLGELGALAERGLGEMRGGEKGEEQGTKMDLGEEEEGG